MRDQTGSTCRIGRVGQQGSHSIQRAGGKGRGLFYVILWNLQAMLWSFAAVCACIFEGRMRRSSNGPLPLPFLPTTSRGLQVAKEQRQHIFCAATAEGACMWHRDLGPSFCVTPSRAPAESLTWPLVLSVERLAFSPEPSPSGEELSPILKEAPHFSVAQGKRRLD